MSNKDFKQIAEKYQELSTIYQNVYEDLIQQMSIISQLQGVWTEIKSECIKYTSKTKKVAEQAENRLKIIESAIYQFDYLINEKERQNMMIKKLTEKYSKCYYENIELKKQIEANEKAWTVS